VGAHRYHYNNNLRFVKYQIENFRSNPIQNREYLFTTNKNEIYLWRLLLAAKRSKPLSVQKQNYCVAP